MKSMMNKPFIPIIFSVFFGCFLFFISVDFIMFWDNVLFASKMGNHLYFNSIFNWNIPDAFDPGHPPFLGFLLAAAWKLLGHSLWVSHLVMLPFIIGTLYQLFRFVNHYIKNHFISYFGFFLVLADPSLATSFVLVNPEVIILFFFFLAFNGILYNQKHWKFIGMLFLSIITFRSMMLFAGLLLFDILNCILIQKRSARTILNLKFIGFYLFASLPGFFYVTWRLLTKGWLQTHPDSPWASLWHFASFKQFLTNIVVLGWRYLDFGRVFIFVFLISTILILRKKILKDKQIQELLLLGVSSVIFVIIACLFSTNAFGHRYFIVSYICFILIAFLILLQIKKNRKILYTLLLAGLISGNFWIYPEKISQGWDATLAHVPYHTLREDALNYIKKEKIDFQEVGTFFPNCNTLDEIGLDGDPRHFSHFNQKNPYIFYSNVYNVSDEDFNFIKENYNEIKRFSHLGVYVAIFRISLK